MVSVSFTPRCVRDCFFFYKFYELFSLNSTFINYHQVHSCPWQESRNEVVDDHAVALFLNLDWSHQFRHFRNFDDHQLDRHIRAMLWVPENVLLRSFSISLQMHSCLQTEGDLAALIIIVIWEWPPPPKKKKKEKREKIYIGKSFKLVRDRCRHQNGWDFGKVPNGLRPPLVFRRLHFFIISCSKSPV